MTTPPEQPFDPRDIPYGTYFLGLVIVGAIAALTFIAPLRNSVFATFGINVLPSFVCGTSQVQDADGNSYDTVLIGTQCWMAQNLRVGTTVNISTTQTDNATIEKWCYSDTDANCDTNDNPSNPDGGLYQWDEAMQYSTTPGAQGICPDGWHIPTDAEWHTLESYLATGSCDPSRSAAYDCDPAGTALKPNGSSGFEGNLAGLVFGSFDGRGTYGFFWSSSESGANAWSRHLGSSESRLYRSAGAQIAGLSVRCLKDDPTSTNPTVTIATTPSIPALDDGLVGHWTFDGPDVRWQDTTSEIKDVSGNGHHGDATTTVSQSSSPTGGVLGQALQFDGTSGYILIPDNDAFSYTDGAGNDQPFSVGGWIRHTIDEGDFWYTPEIIAKNKGVWSEWQLSTDIDGRIGLQVIDTGNEWLGRRYGTALATAYPDEWVHVFATYDGSHTSAGIKIYINGQRSDDLTDENDAIDYNGMSNTTDPVTISKDSSIAAINGSLDDVRIYNRVLSADEVMRLYKLGEGTKIATTIKTPGSPLEQGLVGHWTFDGPDVRWQDTTSEIKDVSGNNNHGDAQGGMGVNSPIAGVLGQGMAFDGVGNYLDIGTLSSVQSVSFWMQTETATVDILRPFSSSSRRNAASVVSAGGGDPGTSIENVSNFLLDDGNLGRFFEMGPSERSPSARFTNFGFNLPSNATITGFEVRMELDPQFTNPLSAHAQLYDGGLVGSVKNTGSLPSAYSTQVLGSVTDTWSAGLTPSDVNASTFGVEIYGQRTDGSAGTQNLFMDYSDITVHYIVPDDGVRLTASVVVSDISESITYVDGVAATALTPGEWHHVVIVFPDEQPAQSVLIGAIENYFDGALDDVRFYNRALSAQEVQQLYQLGR